ncbi:collagen binding domain-containing protein [Oceanicoccus sp. KOV_DT_Chl]|uniref:MSCRAMM family protein n=1 Tax=Oceanicoccus sp. KOV_DT_Chl TaxID=1904639 RepID=UPI000C7C2CFA|nr:carboxypeptidase-like regulatory domain-containing protein [Oceanicoccus sp. KOV_DT_Chl]
MLLPAFFRPLQSSFALIILSRCSGLCWHLAGLIFCCLILASNGFAEGFADDLESYDKQISESLLNDDNLLIVDIYLGNYKIAENIFIYSSPEVTVIPLQPLFDSIEFPIEVDPTAGKAVGWFISEDQRFDLNTAEHSVFINDQRQTINQQAIIVSDDLDLYVDVRLLKKWLPLAVELDTGRLRLIIDSEQPLPLEAQLAREKLRDRALGITNSEPLPQIADNYDWLGEPLVYINMGYQIQHREQPADAQQTDDDEYYTVQANGDLLGMEGRFSMTKAPNDTSHREIFTLYKRPPTQDESLLAGLKYIAIGDIYAVSDSLIFAGGEGLGIDLQFGAATSGSGFGKKLIEGEGPPGWEVELYRNGSLLAFQTVGSDGRYRFTDVPVEYGENIFDLRLFGPQGQERSSRQSINVGNEMLAKGKTTGRLSFTNLGESVIDKEQQNRVDEYGNVIEVRAGLDDKKVYAQVKHGVSDWLAVAIAAAEHKNVLGLGEDNQYTELGFSGALPGASIELNRVWQAGAGHADLISGQTRIGATALSFLHQNYTEFSSDRNPGGLIDAETEVRLSGQFTPFTNAPVNYNITFNKDQFENGIDTNTWDSLLGFQLFNGRLSINSTYIDLDDNNNSDNIFVGRTSYTRVATSNISIRADLNYRIEPESELTSAATRLTWFPSQRIRAQLGLNKDLTRNGTDSMDISASYLLEQVTFSASAFFNEHGDNSVFLSAEFSFGYEGNSRWTVSGQSRGQHGRVKARVFHDLDRNGIYSSGDQPLAGVEFLGRNRWQDKKTGSDGIVYLDGLSTDGNSVLAVNQDTLADPYLKPLLNKSQVHSHAGGVNPIDVAVITTVEAEGSLSILRQQKPAPLAGIPITLKNREGKTVATTLTEFDGFYVFAGLAPGHYWLTIDEDALQRFNVQFQNTLSFHASASDGVTYIDDIVLNTAGQKPESP